MATEIYGASDDLIEADGDVRGEVGFYVARPSEHGSALVICSDGTILEMKYGKGSLGIWSIVPLATGSLFDRIDPCEDEDAGRYSDTAHFRDGLKRIFVATKWERME